MVDIHLDMCDEEVREKFFFDLAHADCDAVLIGGDIADGPHTVSFLRKLAKLCSKPIYFVLGNHDYYGRSIDLQRYKMKILCESHPSLIYLTLADPVALSQNCCFIGHDGWNDAREGDFFNSTVTMRDYSEIEDLKGLNLFELKEKLQELGKEAAASLEVKLEQIADRYEKVIIMTHTVPFRQACFYDGKVADDGWAPHFVCQAVGKMVKRFAKKHPQIHFLLLAGHSHAAAKIAILPNLDIQVSPAEYGSPAFEILVM